MRRLFLLVTGLIAVGCGGTHPDLNPMAGEVSRLQDEVRSISNDSTSGDLLAHSEDLSSSYETARDGSQWDAASMFVQESRTAGRVALAAAQAARWSDEADACRRTAAEVRGEWLDAVAMLEQSEKVAGRRARGVTREVPASPEPEGFPELIPPPSEVISETSLIRDSAQDWKLAA